MQSWERAAFEMCIRDRFLVDPPYLSTEVGTYKMFWRLADYLDVLTLSLIHI